MSSFVDTILLHTKASESPRRYYYWSALTAIAAVVKNHVWLDKFQYKLYPNVYTLLVGKSGLRKGPPINLAKALVAAVGNTRLIAGRASIQAIISELATSRSPEGGGAPITDASAFIPISEFASFLIGDPQALTILTDLYDSHYHAGAQPWINRTKISGQEKLKNPCVTMLAASNEIHLKEAIPPNAMGGGFYARTFVIFADKKASINALVDKPEGLLPWEGMVSQLTQISKAKGQFLWMDDAKDYYRDWYQKFQESEETDDTTGTLERLHDHILKTAMLISLSRLPDLRLELADVQEAVKACMDFIPGSKRVALGQSQGSISAPGTAVLLRELITRDPHEISRAEALKKHWQHFDSFELDRIAESLEAQRAISIRPDRSNGKLDVMYVLNNEVLERYKEREERKKK